MKFRGHCTHTSTVRISESDLQKAAQRACHNHRQCCTNNPDGTLFIVRAHHPNQGREHRQNYDDEQQHAGNHDVEIAASMPVHHVVVDDNHGPENNQRPTEKIRALDFAFPEAVERLPNFLGPHERSSARSHARNVACAAANEGRNPSTTAPIRVCASMATLTTKIVTADDRTARRPQRNGQAWRILSIGWPLDWLSLVGLRLTQPLTAPSITPLLKYFCKNG